MNFNDTTFARDSPLTRFNADGSDSIFLKEELRLTTNSYKIRGVSFFFTSTRDLPRSIEVLSAGNLALATAYECQKRGIACTAIVPAGISAVKKRIFLRLGAKVEERPFDEIWTLVFHSDMRERDDFLHPLNPKLVAGYGAIARKIREQLPHCDGLVIFYGLGGLALGIIRQLQTLGSSIPVVVCEIAGHAPFSRRQQSGDPSRGPKLQSFIEAMGTPEVIPDIFTEVASYVTETTVVDENAVRDGIKAFFLKRGIRAEGAAGASFAAAMELKRQGRGAPVAVLTGGNISDSVFDGIIRD